MQNGSVIKISGRWYVRYWERRNVNGSVENRRVSHCLGPVATRGKHPPADIEKAAQEHMATLGTSKIPAAHIITLGQFVSGVFLPWVEQHRRPSTLKGYRVIWNHHLKNRCAGAWLKDIQTHDVQRWLDDITQCGDYGKRTLAHIKNALSGIFSEAARLGYMTTNPAKLARIEGGAKPEQTHAATLEEIAAILAVLPEPAATAYAVAAYAGLRVGEVEGLRWEDLRDGHIYVSRSIWAGRENPPKTNAGLAPVPIIAQLKQRLELYRLRCGNPQSGWTFKTSTGTRESMGNLTERTIRPALLSAGIPWSGWHSARRGLSTNLHRLGVSDKDIQRVLRHADVATTQAHYILPDVGDASAAMSKLETELLDSKWTVNVSEVAQSKSVN